MPNKEERAAARAHARSMAQEAKNQVIASKLLQNLMRGRLARKAVAAKRAAMQVEATASSQAGPGANGWAADEAQVQGAGGTSPSKVAWDVIHDEAGAQKEAPAPEVEEAPPDSEPRQEAVVPETVVDPYEGLTPEERKKQQRVERKKTRKEQKMRTAALVMMVHIKLRVKMRR